MRPETVSATLRREFRDRPLMDGIDDSGPLCLGHLVGVELSSSM